MNIFIVVGTQEPFDRMIKIIDAWASKNNKHRIFAQISKAAYKPKSFSFTEFISPELFDEHFNNADLIISHAGMGTIISALTIGKPIIVMPRLAKNHEQRNDHQLATAKSFEKLGYVKAVYNETELIQALDEAEKIKVGKIIGSDASPQLIKALRNIINQ
ncbi:MAG: PssE/Cps14G family polysaccharide biosynthesis glycosyltransferase [Lentimicrobium sp.]|jgi:UDP-N-acetylglucosamine transferase subunit ALG13|nr:PssE/Cps14G family polysaccharide biosynthesis glycosyltransferase [Lentimicrobium sp.]